jgi:hypothetical protein
MRRVKAILVIVALLSMPLAVLAQSASEDMPSCGGDRKSTRLNSSHEGRHA